jgi:simple sugar transport system permease protein
MTRLTRGGSARFGLSLLNSVIPVVAAFLLGAVIIALIGEQPWTTYQLMFSQTLFDWGGFLKTLHYASPLVLTGLAIAITFKANVFNMGVEGQMLGGAFTACVIGFSLKGLPSVLHIGLALLAAVVVGMLLALVPAILKAYLGVNEIVVTLMLNYAIIEVLRVLSQTVFRDAASGYVSTPSVAPSAMFTRLSGTSLTLFSLVVLVVFAGMYVVFTRSRLGYEITAMGINPDFAEASGMNVRRKIITIMLISGALSGLAGAGFMLSEKFKYTLDFSGNPGLGWDGMLVALLGGNNPIAILIAAILYAALKTGADAVSIYSSVPKEIVAVIQGLIILLLSIRYITPKPGGRVRRAAPRTTSKRTEPAEAVKA